MIDLTSDKEIGVLKKAFDYSFRGEQGKKTLEFLEQFCGFDLGGPRSGEQISSNQLQYEAGKRDVILTIKTIGREDWSPDTIANFYKEAG